MKATVLYLLSYIFMFVPHTTLSANGLNNLKYYWPWFLYCIQIWFHMARPRANIFQCSSLPRLVRASLYEPGYKDLVSLKFPSEKFRCVHMRTGAVAESSAPTTGISATGMKIFPSEHSSLGNRTKLFDKIASLSQHSG